MWQWQIVEFNTANTTEFPSQHSPVSERMANYGYNYNNETDL